jgi:hypothetical protein
MMSDFGVVTRLGLAGGCGEQRVFVAVNTEAAQAP